MQGRKKNLAFPLRIKRANETGYLVSGEDPAAIFTRRINEPCRHQPCPYALLGLGLLDTPAAARAAYRRRHAWDGELAREREKSFKLRIYRVQICSPVVGTPARRCRDQFLDELCEGPAEGAAWSQVRQHIDHDRLEAIRFRWPWQTTVLVLFQRAYDIVDVTDIEAL